MVCLVKLTARQNKAAKVRYCSDEGVFSGGKCALVVPTDLKCKATEGQDEAASVEQWKLEQSTAALPGTMRSLQSHCCLRSLQCP